MEYKYKINQTNKFENELRNIFDYLYFNLKEPRTAENMLKLIINKIYSLQYFPEKYPKLNNSPNKNLRKLYVKNYIIIYEVNHLIRSNFYFTYFSLFTRLFLQDLIIFFFLKSNHFHI